MSILAQAESKHVNLPKQIDELLAELKLKGSNMAIAKSMEFSDQHHWVVAGETSGQRAFRADALNPILAGNKKWLTMLEGSKYGLEEALNALIPKKYFSQITFYAQTALRKPSAKNQGGQRRLIQDKIAKRKAEARKIIVERKFKRAARLL